MKKNRKSLYFLLLIFSIIPVLIRSQDSQVKFGHNIGILSLKDQSLRYPALSPDGNFVFANADLYQMDSSGNIMTTDVLETTHLLWDLGKLKIQTSIMKINPEKFILDKSTKAQRGFSPDGQYLAVKTTQELQIFTVPNLKFLQSVPAVISIGNDYDHYLSWSPDSRLLASWADGEIITWDIEKNIVYRYKLNYRLANIQYIENGWFIQILDGASSINRESTDPFIVCSLQLEKCDTYEHPKGTGIIVSPDGQTVLTTKVDIEKINIVAQWLEIWQRGSDNIYRQIAEQPLSLKDYNSPTGFCPNVFSPDSQYITSLCGYANIWKLGEKAPLQSIPHSTFLIWLPNSEYFVVLDSLFSLKLRLFKVGMNQPIDTLNLEIVPGLENIRLWLLGFMADQERLTVNQNGDLLLLNLGFAALAVPIEYQ